MKMTVFWDFAHCSLMAVDQQIRGAYCLYEQGIIRLIALMVEEACTSETLVNFRKTAWHIILEGCCLQKQNFFLV
jgi:hypothetical protein